MDKAKLLQEKIDNMKAQKFFTELDERFLQRKVLKEKGLETQLANAQEKIKQYDEMIGYLEEVSAELKK